MNYTDDLVYGRNLCGGSIDLYGGRFDGICNQEKL